MQNVEAILTLHSKLSGGGLASGDSRVFTNINAGCVTDSKAVYGTIDLDLKVSIRRYGFLAAEPLYFDVGLGQLAFKGNGARDFFQDLVL